MYDTKFIISSRIKLTIRVVSVGVTRHFSMQWKCVVKGKTQHNANGGQHSGIFLHFTGEVFIQILLLCFTKS